MTKKQHQNLAKSIVVLARRDPIEAMRVAAGLTIFDHNVNVVLTQGPIEITDEIVEAAELLELSDVVVHTLVDEPEVEKISQDELCSLIEESDFVATI